MAGILICEATYSCMRQLVCVNSDIYHLSEKAPKTVVVVDWW